MHTSGGKVMRSLNAAPYQVHLFANTMIIFGGLEEGLTPPGPSVSWALPTTAEYSMTRQDMMRGGRMPRHDQPMKDADQQRYDGGAAVRL